MIRRDKTKYNPSNDASNWSARMFVLTDSPRKQVAANSTLDYYERIGRSGTPSERKEAELALRIANATTNDNAASRNIERRVAIKRGDIMAKIDSERRYAKSQNEEIFREEQLKERHQRMSDYARAQELATNSLRAEIEQKGY